MTRFEMIIDFYNNIKDMNDDESLELILQAEDKDEQDFITMLGDFLLQKRQQEAIEQKRF
jgi:hypothetical protein